MLGGADKPGFQTGFSKGEANETRRRESDNFCAMQLYPLKSVTSGSLSCQQFTDDEETKPAVDARMTMETL